MGYRSYQLRYFGILFCRRGSLPPFFFLRVTPSRASSSSASAPHSTFLYRKCVTFMNDLRFLCSQILERTEVLLLPMYTMVPLWSSSYAPGFTGAALASSSVKGRAFALVSAITHLPVLRPFYTKYKIDDNSQNMLTLAKKLGGAAWTRMPNSERRECSLRFTST